MINIEKLSKKRYLNIIYFSIFYLLLNSFGFNDSQYRVMFLQLLTVYFVSSLLKIGDVIFYSINFAIFVYYFAQDGLTFTFLFLQLLFITTYQTNEYQFLRGLNIWSRNIAVSQKQIFSLSLIFFIVIVTQNIYLNFEIIDHDTSTSILVANDLFHGYLPYERQWDDKQPLFYVLNSLILYISDKNYLVYKIFFDIFTFFNAALIFLIAQKRNSQSYFASTISSCIYIFISSQPWATSEYSEIMSLTFIGGSYFLATSSTFSKYRYISAGLLFAFATLINIGTALFSFGFLAIFLIGKPQDIYKKILYFSFGFIPMHLLVLLIYYANGLIKIYLTTLISIPFSYTSTDTYFFYDIRVFIESLFNTNLFLSVVFLLLFFNTINIINNIIHSKFQHFQINSYILFLTLSVIFFFLAGKGYYHHFLYVVFFLPMSVSYIDGWHLKLTLYVSIALLSVLHIAPLAKDSFNNISSFEDIYNDYPIKKLSEKIDERFESDDYSILALDNLLVLYYLDKPNESYIVHPTNHNEYFIINNLINKNLISNNYLQTILNKRPDVIVCSISKDGKLYYELSTYLNFKCDERELQNSTVLKIPQEIFSKSEFYHNSNKINKVIFNSR